MQRQIKFRVWDKELKQFSSPSCHTLSKNSNHIYSIKLTPDVFKISGSERFVIQQSTGIIDSEEKEIFEGDIISWRGESSDERIAPVIFSPSCAAFVLDSSGRHLFDDEYGDYYPLHRRIDYKIIGNIFEQ